MMLSSVARRTLLSGKNSAVIVQQARPFSSLTPPQKNERRELHNSARREADAATPFEAVKKEEAKSSPLTKRLVMTAEVTVSKIFPAGFCWQASSIVAATKLGYATDSMAFALTTGFGDAMGVLLGHCAFYGAKKAIVDNSIDMKKELQTGIFLGSAAFCSGTAWQPLVDALQGANLSFMQVFAGTWLGCGTAFYVGLRVGRTIFSGFMEHIQEPTYENSLNDKSLSAVIGGATGFFVGTDAAYLPDQNFLIDVVGIQDGTPDLTGCVIAGTSTSLGFVTSQSVFNIIYPAGKCWND
jgi:hypothetical protein